MTEITTIPGAPITFPAMLDRRVPPCIEEAPLSRFMRTLGEFDEGRDCLRKFLAQMFVIRESKGEARAATERFIHDRFSRAYGANVTSYMPQLFELLTRRGELTAVFGVRSAAQGPLFLETYLAAPIEDVLERKLGSRPPRARIVEIGNLAAIYPGAVRWLIVALTVHLYREGYEWVVFTATAELKNGLRRFGLRPIPLAKADVALLSPERRAAWGSYYDTQPTVMAGNISHVFHELETHYEIPDVTGVDSMEVDR
jgi:hypothetical protein